MDGAADKARTSLQIDTPGADLPVAPPLTHDLFLSDRFDADDFLLERRHGASLDDLRSELRTYLAELRNELVAVINEDYEDFIGLGIGLRGTDKRLERMRLPVENVKTQIEGTRSELVELQTAIQAKLDERSHIREQKATLRLLLSINDSVLKVEALLLIESPVESVAPGTAGSSKDDKRSSSALRLSVRPERQHTTGVKRVERVAAEYNQLLYLMEKADGLAFVRTLDKRIDQIRTTLQRDMSSLLSNALHTRPNSSDTLYDILRIFQSARKTQEAEDVVRKELVRPWLSKHVTRDSLTGPPSPAVPPTPQLGEPKSPPLANGTHVDGHTSRSSFDPIPCPTNDPLIDLYNKILAFVARDCAPILEAADRRLRYSLLVAVVWDEVLSRLTSELGTTIFAAGRAEIFHSNYIATSAFFSRFEAFCQNQKQLIALRNAASTEAFQKRWQRPVYFQLRFKEIVNRLEDALDSRLGLESKTGGKSVFVLAATEATHRAIWTCWQPDVLLPELTPRFWRLSLQLLSRYKRWLDDVMPAYMPGSRRPSADLTRDPSVRLPVPSLPPTRPATPQSTEMSEEATVRQLTLIVVDTRRIEEHVKELFSSTIAPALVVSAEAEAQPSAALDAAATSIAGVAPPLVSQIVSALVRQCNEPLRPSLRSVISEVRASSKSTPPTTVSHLVPRVLKPLKSYFEAFPGRELDADTKARIAGEVLDEIAQRYASVLNDNREAEASLRRLKKGRQGFSLFGRAQADDNAAADDGNVKVQLQLDASAFEEEANALGATTVEAKGFEALRQAVQ